ncbi:MAG: TonB family protein [Proteobacteria bacterium]|nr:TonB family protein [Pseudomonadota bacterium]
MIASLGLHLNLALILLLVREPPRPPPRSRAVEVELAVAPAPTAIAAPTLPPALRPLRARPPAVPPRVAPTVVREAPPPPVPPAVEPTRPLKPLDRARTMVELDTPRSEREPDEARFLSDQNRRVERETRAKQTTLEPGDQPAPMELALATAPPPSTPAEPPAARSGVRDAPAQQARDAPAPAPAPQPPAAPPPRAPLLAMRGRSRSAAGPAGADATPPPQLGAGRRPALAASPAPAGTRPSAPVLSLDRLALDHQGYDRVFGAGAARERELALRTPSVARGGVVQGRWNRLRAALENFTPDVRPGNQTALNTRADPFAVYIARMHRRIHTRWGFGFLVTLDQKPNHHPLNDMTLQTTIEIAVAPAGDVAKATIVRPSGQLVFDTAALDTVFSAAPFPPTPAAIRSANGQVYLHWSFHRDERQCGTFGVQPFILTEPGDSLRHSQRDPVGGAGRVRSRSRAARTGALDRKQARMSTTRLFSV